MRGIDFQLIQRIASAAGGRLARKLIRRLRSADADLLTDGGVGNLWNEICVQTQTDSVWRESYAEQMEARLLTLVGALSEIERLSIWLCVGDDYWFNERNEIGRMDAALAAVSDTELARYILNEHVRYEAMNYENKTIRAMIGQ